jgi:hypothetical protein
MHVCVYAYVYVYVYVYVYQSVFVHDHIISYARLLPVYVITLCACVCARDD